MGDLALKILRIFNKIKTQQGLSFLCFFLVLPFILILWIFWKDVSIPITYERTSEGKVHVELDISNIDADNVRNLIRKVFEVPFDLNTYQFCFENRTRFTQNEQENYLPGLITLENLNGDVIGQQPVEANSRACVLTQEKELYISNVTVSFAFDPNTPLTVDADIAPYNAEAEPPFSEKVIASLLFFFAWWALVLLLINVFKIWTKVPSMQRPLVERGNMGKDTLTTKLEDSIFLRVIDFGLAYPNGFSYHQLMDGLELKGWERKVVDEYIEAARRNAFQKTNGGTRGVVETPFFLVEQGESFGYQDNAHKYIIGFDANFKFIDYHELKFARENAREAKFLAVIAILVSVGAVIATSLITQTVKLDEVQLKSLQIPSTKIEAEKVPL